MENNQEKNVKHTDFKTKWNWFWDKCQLPKRKVDEEYPFYFKLYNWKTDGMIFLITSLIIPLVTLLICGLALRMGHSNPVIKDDYSMMIYTVVNLISNLVGFYLLYNRDSKLLFKSGLSIFYWFIFVTQLVGLVIGIIVAAAKLNNDKQVMGMINIWAQIIAELIILYLAFKQTNNLKQRILMTLKQNWLMFLIVIVIGGGVTYGLTVGFSAIPGLNHVSKNQDNLNEPFENGSTVYKVFYAISLFVLSICVAPLTEELATRQAIYAGISNRTIAFFVSAVYFAMMHVQTGDVENIVPYLIGGFCLSGVFSISRGNVTYDTGTHAIYNLIGFIIIVATK